MRARSTTSEGKGDARELWPRERGSLFESKSRYNSSYAWVCDDDELDLHRREQLAFNRFVMTGGVR